MLLLQTAFKADGNELLLSPIELDEFVWQKHFTNVGNSKFVDD